MPFHEFHVFRTLFSWWTFGPRAFRTKVAVGLDEADGSWVAGRGGIYDLVMNSWCLVGIFWGLMTIFMVIIHG